MRKIIPVVILLLLVGFPLRAQDTIRKVEIDLAKIDEDYGNEISFEVDNSEKISLVIINTLPSMRYIIRTGSVQEVLKALDLNINTEPKGCAELYEAEKFNLFYEIDEKIIRLIKQKYKDDLDEYCENKEQNAKFLDSLYQITQRYAFKDGIVLQQEDIINVKIIRDPSKNDPKEHEWNVAIIGKEKCEDKIKEVTVAKPVYINSNGEGSDGASGWIEYDNWSLSYGFAFPIMFSNDEYYYVAVSDSTPGMYEIKKEKDNQYIRFIPSIFLHWNPSDKDRPEWSYSATGGIGFDLENPIVFAGGSIAYHSKLNFNFGLVVHKVHKLNGKYSTGELINDILLPDQLHTQHYRMNPFIGISFRF